MTAVMTRAVSHGVDITLLTSSSEPIPANNLRSTVNLPIDGQQKETDHEKIALKKENRATTQDMDDDDDEEVSPDDNPKMFKHATERLFVKHSASKKSKGSNPGLKRTHSAPQIKYDDCREFDNFSGEWIDSKGQQVLISPWGVIRYPNNPKLRFEAIYMGPNHLSVTFDKDPKRRKFVGKLNHDCELLIWSNDTKWAKKGSKHDPRFHPIDGKKGKLQNNNSNNGGHKKRNSNSKNGSCLIQ